MKRFLLCVASTFMGISNCSAVNSSMLQEDEAANWKKAEVILHDVTGTNDNCWTTLDKAVDGNATAYSAILKIWGLVLDLPQAVASYLLNNRFVNADMRDYFAAIPEIREAEQFLIDCQKRDEEQQTSESIPHTTFTGKREEIQDILCATLGKAADKYISHMCVHEEGTWESSKLWNAACQEDKDAYNAICALFDAGFSPIDSHIRSAISGEMFDGGRKFIKKFWASPKIQSCMAMCCVANKRFACLEYLLFNPHSNFERVNEVFEKCFSGKVEILQNRFDEILERAEQGDEVCTKCVEQIYFDSSVDPEYYGDFKREIDGAMAKEFWKDSRNRLRPLIASILDFRKKYPREDL